MPKVFVFGTLKEGFPNHRSNRGVRFRSEFETIERYPLYLVGDRYSPWLILQKGSGSRVSGQVFQVSDEALAVMDKLERITEPDGYNRVEICVRCKVSNDQFVVYAYGKPRQQINPKDVKRELTGEYSAEDALLYSRRSF
ncbi:gamma-glutamylcyclotransferase [Agarivorans sp. DSG3-1]|uniref:gamma-glutamylcyclotransferase family protein n=1 Tax=Agarivorans sp. DSG3-1 TaxID=3342249 RepID=UPI00398E7B37